MYYLQVASKIKSLVLDQNVLDTTDFTVEIPFLDGNLKNYTLDENGKKVSLKV